MKFWCVCLQYIHKCLNMLTFLAFFAPKGQYYSREVNRQNLLWFYEKNLLKNLKNAFATVDLSKNALRKIYGLEFTFRTLFLDGLPFIWFIATQRDLSLEYFSSKSLTLWWDSLFLKTLTQCSIGECDIANSFDSFMPSSLSTMSFSLSYHGLSVMYANMHCPVHQVLGLHSLISSIELLNTVFASYMKLDFVSLHCHRFKAIHYFRTAPIKFYPITYNFAMIRWCLLESTPSSVQ